MGRKMEYLYRGWDCFDDGHCNKKVEHFIFTVKNKTEFLDEKIGWESEEREDIGWG